MPPAQCAFVLHISVWWQKSLLFFSPHFYPVTAMRKHRQKPQNHAIRKCLSFCVAANYLAQSHIMPCVICINNLENSWVTHMPYSSRPCWSLCFVQTMDITICSVCTITKLSVCSVQAVMGMYTWFSLCFQLLYGISTLIFYFVTNAFFCDVCHALILKWVWLFFVSKLNMGRYLTRCSSCRCVTSASTHQRQTVKSQTTVMVSFTELLIFMWWTALDNNEGLSRWFDIGPVLSQLFLSVTTFFSLLFLYICQRLSSYCVTISLLQDSVCSGQDSDNDSEVIPGYFMKDMLQVAIF